MSHPASSSTFWTPPTSSSRFGAFMRPCNAVVSLQPSLQPLDTLPPPSPSLMNFIPLSPSITAAPYLILSLTTVQLSLQLFPPLLPPLLFPLPIALGISMAILSASLSWSSLPQHGLWQAPSLHLPLPDPYTWAHRYLSPPPPLPLPLPPPPPLSPGVSARPTTQTLTATR